MTWSKHHTGASTARLHRGKSSSIVLELHVESNREDTQHRVEIALQGTFDLVASVRGALLLRILHSPRIVAGKITDNASFSVSRRARSAAMEIQSMRDAR